jgi:hypothetical protein
MFFVRQGPLWFRMTTGVLVLWGLVGCFMCLQQLRLGADAMGEASAYDRALYATLPNWYDPLFAVAVLTGQCPSVLDRVAGGDDRAVRLAVRLDRHRRAQGGERDAGLTLRHHRGRRVHALARRPCPAEGLGSMTRTTLGERDAARY